MKSFLNKLGRVVAIIGFIILFIATITFIVLFLVRNKQFNDLNSLYSQAQDNLNTNSTENQVTINNLQQSFNDLNTEVASLKNDNKSLQDQLDKQKKDGYGEIDGKISGQIVIGDNNISQYQQVCAVNTSNTNLQYCLNVSAIGQSYALILPAGTYQVFARVLDKDSKVALTTYRGVYTEYIKCVNDKGASQCDTKLSKNIVNVVVKAADKVVNVNPVDWGNV